MSLQGFMGRGVLHVMPASEGGGYPGKLGPVFSGLTASGGLLWPRTSGWIISSLTDPGVRRGEVRRGELRRGEVRRGEER